MDIVHERIANGEALFDNHVFQFDFLNDSFDKLPKGLKDIIDDSERRIGFFVWKTEAETSEMECDAEVYDAAGNNCGKKSLVIPPKGKLGWTG